MKTKKIAKRVTSAILAIGIIAASIPCSSLKHDTTGLITTEAATNGIKVNSTLTSAQQKELTFNARFYASTNKDVVDLLGDKEEVLYQHYLEYGIKEGRCATPVFDPVYYLENNGDLMAAYGRDYVAAYKHWLEYGYAEGRASSAYYEGSYYHSYYGDLAHLNSYELVRHFLNYGIFEQRTASSTGKKSRPSHI